jgi:hypothetical protein
MKRASNFRWDVPTNSKPSSNNVFNRASLHVCKYNKLFNINTNYIKKILHITLYYTSKIQSVIIKTPINIDIEGILLHITHYMYIL